ncbi:MAG TPA: response regulator transcription factor [Nocardioides sp.]|jgi:DNA-binding NarL/FixJ family response regulator|nr:response regulator transcription factor [Nocardioides sp.]
MSEVPEHVAGSPEQPIRVLIVDDHEVLAASLAMVLDAEDDIRTAGVATTLEQARTLLESTLPDVILLDHRMPDGDGVAAIPELRALRPTIGVVVLTASAADHVLMSAIENGASGFLSKTRSLDEVTAAVRAAAAGESVISPELLARLLPRFGRGKDTPEDELTDREREVLALVAEGLSNAAIAERLVVSVHTVRNHIASLSAKLGAHSKLEALSVAVRQGMLPDL